MVKNGGIKNKNVAIPINGTTLSDVVNFLPIPDISNVFTIPVGNKLVRKASIVIDDTNGKTIAVSNVLQRCELTIEIDFQSQANVTWFSGIDWVNGEPTLTAGNKYTFMFYTSDGGVSWTQEDARGILAEVQNMGANVDTLIAKNYAMGKAEFQALQEKRKRDHAGSGFVEWGKRQGSSLGINEGMYAIPSQVNLLFMGDAYVPNGISRTNHPILSVEGVQLNVKGVNRYDTQNHISFPPAPDGTKTYDSATGVVTTHASSNEAFEGLLTNGDFRNGITGWSVPAGTLTVADRVATLETDCDYIYNTLTGLTEGATYRVSVFVEAQSVVSTVKLGSSASGGVPHNLKVGNNEFEIVATSDPKIYFNQSANNTLSIRNVSVMPKTEKVIMSRQDLVFLETWHEKISDKDIVCPFGNTQYGGSTFDGISLVTMTALSVDQSYSAFGEWDTTTNGRAVKWSTLSDENKKILLDNPEHNIYYDSEPDQLIQVRYRMRVIEGMGNNWQKDLPLIDASLYYSTVNGYVISKGALTTSVDVDAPTNSRKYSNETAQVGDLAKVGTFVTRSADYSVSHTGRAYCVPIALVQRLNKGGHHPVLNPSGTARFNRVGSWSNDEWYLTSAYKPTSQLECFIFTNGDPGSNNDYCTYVNSGSIASALTGRNDQYLYHDAIYMGQVKDLRLNANKLDANTLNEAVIRKSVAGKTRGWGGVPFIPKVKIDNFVNSTPDYLSSGQLTILTGFNSYVGTKVSFSPNMSSSMTGLLGAILVHCETGDLYKLVQRNNSNLSIHKLTDGTWVAQTSAMETLNGDEFLIISITKWDTDATSMCYVGSSIATNIGDGYRPVIPYIFKTSDQFDYPQVVDIVGSPENILATFPNGVIGQWIPEIPDGTEKEFEFNKKYNTSPSIIYTSDNGQTWSYSAGPSGVDAVKNSRTVSSPADIVTLYQYEARSKFTESASNCEIINVGDAFISSHPYLNQGNRLTESLSGLICKNDAGLNRERVKLNKFKISDNKFELSSYAPKPSHEPLSMPTPNNDSPAIKTIISLVEKNDLLYVQYNWRELFYDDGGTSGNEWGDTFEETTYTNACGTFTIVDGESTLTDLNGNVVRYGTHRELLPIGIINKNEGGN